MEENNEGIIFLQLVLQCGAALRLHQPLREYKVVNIIELTVTLLKSLLVKSSLCCLL
jgi:hypothetical protein